MTGLDTLLDRWEREIELLRACGCTEAASAREVDLRELREFWREMEIRTVDTEEAVQLSGYTASALRKMRERGELSDAGPGRYLQAELPRKARRRSPRRATVHDTADEAVLGRARGRGA